MVIKSIIELIIKKNKKITNKNWKTATHTNRMYEQNVSNVRFHLQVLLTSEV
jgi:hypothetical protein